MSDLAPTKTNDASCQTSMDEFKAVVARAEAGDESSLPMLRAFLDKEFEGFARVNVEKEARHAIIEPLCGKNLMAQELIMREMRRVARELAGDKPTPIEQMLANRAALCWHIVNHYERAYAQAGSITLNQARYHQDRIDRAHKRYLSALKTLAAVRKLALPAIQVNVAKNQVNVVGS